MINLIIVDDHELFVQGLKDMLESRDPGLKIVDYALNAKEAVEKIKKADIVLLDLNLPDMAGEDLCEHIKTRYKEIKVIILTGEQSEERLAKAWKNGANALISKYCSYAELSATIKSVYYGSRLISKNVPDFSSYLSDRIQGATIKLTKKELTILNYLAEGKKRKEVGELLAIKENTMNFHCRNIFIKFNSSRLFDVIEKAKQENIL